MASVCIFGASLQSFAASSLSAKALARAVQVAKDQANASGKPTAKQAAQRLESKAIELKELKDKASAITSQIGELAAGGKLPTNDEGIKLLQDLVQQLKETSENLKKVQHDVDGILAWIEERTITVATLSADVSKLKKPGISNYMQIQWQDTEEDGTNARNDGFAVRRFRLGQMNKLSDAMTAKFSFDVAAGSQRVAAELKDAFITYVMKPMTTESGKEIAVGQMALPLGYELKRSSSEREMPERSLYNRRLFAGERDRGLDFRFRLPMGFSGHVGIWNGVTVQDPQTIGANTFRDLDNKLAVTAGVRASSQKYDVGISTLQGTRKGFVPTGGGATVPDTDRNLWFIDASYADLFTKGLVFRGEVMFGKDRDPIGGIANPTYRRQTEVFGWQAQLTYALNSANQLVLRYEAYDPDTKDVVVGNDRVDIIGFGIIHWFNPGLKITLSYEVPREQGTQRRDNVWTVRSQFKL
jgi:hypothetical protein